MNKKFFKDAILYGIILWVIGYVLGIMFFMAMPQKYIGWAIMPIGILVTLWVLIKKVQGNSMFYYLKIAIAWAAIAIVFDYLFLVKLFNPVDGYYKLDVYLYYALAFVLPLIVGIFKTSRLEQMSNLIARQSQEKQEHLQKALALARSQEKITNNDIEKLLGVSDATAERYLDELEKQGRIRQIGAKGGYVYYKVAK
jgi:hypothetical protein